jgi:hypothetical protein
MRGRDQTCAIQRAGDEVGMEQSYPLALTGH